MSITGYTEPHRHSPLTRDPVLAAVNTYCFQNPVWWDGKCGTPSGGMANVGPINPRVEVEVDMREPPPR